MSLFKKEKREKPDLAKLKAERNFIRLIEALKFPDGEVRAGAAKALGEIGDIRVLDDLIKRLKDRDPYVRESAVDAIGNIFKVEFNGDILARIALNYNPPLRALIARENNKFVREKAEIVLNKLLKYLDYYIG